MNFKKLNKDLDRKQERIISSAPFLSSVMPLERALLQADMLKDNDGSFHSSMTNQAFLATTLPFLNKDAQFYVLTNVEPEFATDYIEDVDVEGLKRSIVSQYDNIPLVQEMLKNPNGYECIGYTDELFYGVDLKNRPQSSESDLRTGLANLSQILDISGSQVPNINRSSSIQNGLAFVSGALVFPSLLFPSIESAMDRNLKDRVVELHRDTRAHALNVDSQIGSLYATTPQDL
jgi:hypothetical protein